jgi:hypothetical protein
MSIDDDRDLEALGAAGRIVRLALDGRLARRPAYEIAGLM